MAVVYNKLLDSKSRIAIWKIEETPDDLYKKLQLKEHEINYLQTLENEKRRLHWLSTRVLLRTVLNTDSYIDCRVDEHGKPYLINFPYHISFSHSYDYAAVMVSETNLVGIDIEIIKQKIEKVAEKFLSANEWSFINNKNKINHLYACWCAKEAVYKLHGKKSVSFKNDIYLKEFEYNSKGLINASLITKTQKINFLVNYEEYENYMLGFVMLPDKVSLKT